MQNSTSITNGLIWYEFDSEIPIGFDFQFLGETISHLYTHETFTLPNILTPSNDPVGIHPYLIPFGVSLVDRAMEWDYSNENEQGGVSNISYHLSGTVGSRIFKLEYNNVGFDNDIWVNQTSTDFVNFQIWFYESGNIIELHFGESLINDIEVDFDGEPGPIIAIFPEILLNDEAEGGPISDFYYVFGDANQPDMSFGTNLTLVNGVPANGMVYRFTPENLSTSEISSNSKIEIYPNPVINEFKINSEKEIDFVQIFSLEGKLIKSFNSNSATYDVSSLEKGIYFVKVKSENELKSFKLIKK